jgi:hypothetical protein
MLSPEQSPTVDRATLLPLAQAASACPNLHIDMWQTTLVSQQGWRRIVRFSGTGPRWVCRTRPLQSSAKAPHTSANNSSPSLSRPRLRLRPAGLQQRYEQRRRERIAAGARPAGGRVGGERVAGRIDDAGAARSELQLIDAGRGHF